MSTGCAVGGELVNGHRLLFRRKESSAWTRCRLKRGKRAWKQYSLRWTLRGYRSISGTAGPSGGSVAFTHQIGGKLCCEMRRHWFSIREQVFGLYQTLMPSRVPLDITVK